MPIPWGTMHAHSKYSANDALDSVETMVAQAAKIGYGAFGLTDHGTDAGIFQHYRSCHEHNILPVPGVEMYVTFDRTEKSRFYWHMGLLAIDNKGWDNLIAIVNQAHRQFYYTPVIDLADLMELGSSKRLEGLWAQTGCLSGIAVKQLHVQVNPWASIQASKNMVELLTNIFHDRVLVEIMNHYIEREGDVSDSAVTSALLHVSEDLEVPIIINTDSHYAHKSSRPNHDMLKRLVYHKGNPDDSLFSGHGYWLLSEEEMRQRFSLDTWQRGLHGFNALMEHYDLTVPDLDHFTLKVPRLASVVPRADRKNGEFAADDALAQRIQEQANLLQLKPSLTKRLSDEFETIIQFGFSSYILLTAEVTDFCRAEGIRFVTRGSASGSLVCYLLGITQIDPIEWGLSFDRFISRDRAKPPDVDIDVQRSRRQEVLDFLAERYAVCHIGTWRELGESNRTEDDKGSLWVKYFAYAKKVQAGGITNSVRQSITALAAHKPYDGIGKHAAGVLIAQDESVLDRLPMQWIASSKTLVCALDKDMIETLGYTKLDVLGLRTLDALMDMETTTSDGPRSLDDPEVFAMIRAGRTDGVFQLSGGAQRRGLPRLNPENMEDIAIALALFRPAVMQSGAMDTFLNRRQGRGESADRHPIIEAHTRSTHSVILFQEQVLEILKAIGLDVDTLNVVLKAVKASNANIGAAAEKMKEVRAILYPMMEDKGFSNDDTEWLENALQAYASYGFNMAHAVSYAHMSYRTAWYKRYYPVDYWCAMLNAYIGHEKEPEYKTALYKDGVMLLPPHVNKSGIDYSIDERYGAIRKGLNSIKGVGEKAAVAIAMHAPYADLADFAERCQNRAVSGVKNLRVGHTPAACGGVVKALDEAGAFSGLRGE